MIKIQLETLQDWYSRAKSNRLPLCTFAISNSDHASCLDLGGKQQVVAINN